MNGIYSFSQNGMIGIEFTFLADTKIRLMNMKQQFSRYQTQGDKE